MSVHYNAFISYKHADLDNKIAAYVEKHLERYHIPGKIRKKTGMKKIERIFRDTDELPITSDLTGTIEEALKNADYLIVICSTNTCKSMWVEREIKLFLQNHPKEKILTVLADGEPVDVVPEILKNREVTRVNENGETVTVVEPVEPLSCDFRLPLRTAKNTELPRLAAALIGCQYNELMDRQRQYKMKRLTAVFAGILALSLGFGAYMFRSNQIIRESRQQISENYRASLISQSKYLANESEKLLENEQRIDALHLALAALPSEEIPDRPVTPEAVRAVTQATLSYVSRDTSNISSEWNYELPNDIENMYVNGQKKLLAAIDQKGNVKVWDTETHKELYYYATSDNYHTAENIRFLEDGNLIVWGSCFVMSVDPRKGSENWNTGKLEDLLSFDYVDVTKDGNLLFALHNGGFVVLSSLDGSIVNTYTFPEEILGKISGMHALKLSPDNTKIAFVFLDREDLKWGYGIYDIPTGKVCVCEDVYSYIPAFSITKDNNVVVSHIEDTSKSNSSVLTMDTLKIDHETIDCLSPEDLSIKWTYDFTQNDVSTASDFIYSEEYDTISYYSGNAATVFNAVTGEVLHDYTLNTCIIYGFYSKGNDTPSFITENGGIVSELKKEEDKDTAHVIKYFTDGLAKAKVSEGIYTVKRNSNRIIFYGTDVYDKELQFFSNAPEADSLYHSYYDDNVVVIMNEIDDGINLDFYDPASKSYTTSAKIEDPDKKAFYYQMLGTYKGKLLMSYADSNIKGFILYSIDYKTGAVESKELNTESGVKTDDIGYDNGVLVYGLQEGSEKNFVITYDLATGKDQRYILPYKSEEYSFTFITPSLVKYFGEQGYIFYAGTESISNHMDYIIDTNTPGAEINPVQHSDPWLKTQHMVLNEDASLIASTDGSTIDINNIKGELVTSFSTFDVRMHGFSFYKEPGTNRELLIVPYTDTNISRYDVSTGELVYNTRYTTSTFTTDEYDAKFTFDKERSCIYLCSSNVLNILDLNTFTEYGFMGSSLGYHAATDTFICKSDDEDHIERIGYFKHYSLDDLIRKAKEILGNHEMPQDQKDAYGI